MADFDTEDAPRPGRKPKDPDLQKRHREALDGFKASASFFSQQRQREVEDLKFVDFDEQWDPTAKANRQGTQAVSVLPPTPPQPTLTINQLRAPCQQVANARRAARLALQFAPKGGGAKQAIAEVFEDIARAMQAESRAAVARNWAADRAEKAGMGWYRIDTEYASDDPTDEASWNDQDIVWRRILNQASVYPDPHAQEPDFSDGRRLYVTEDIPADRYRERFPHSELSECDSSELTAIGDAQPKWVFTSNTGEDGESQPTIRIAECWEVRETERARVMLNDGTGAWEDELDEDGKTRLATGKDARRRVHREREVWFSLINGVEYLQEPTRWNGRYIPFIPCIGEESNVDGERRWTGIVRPGKGAAMSYNVMRSAQVTAIGLATKAPYIGYMETIEPYLPWWNQSNTRPFPILPVKAAKGPDGSVLPPPQRNVQEPAIQAITLAAHEAKDDIHATTGIPPVALGQLDPHDRSGRAIQALQGQAEVGSSGYLDNFVQITLAYEGKVVRDLIPRIFDRPGRIVPAVGLDEKRRLVMLNHPFVEGPDGLPVKLPNWQPGMPVPDQVQGPNGQPLKVQYYDITDGEYSVAPTVGKSYQTRREQASSAIGDVMKVVPPEMAAVIAPAWLEEQDYPGAMKIAEIAKKALPPPLAAAYQDETSQQPNPQVQQLQQQVQQLTQALQSKAAEEQAKQQAQTQRELTKTQLQEQAETERAGQDNATKLQMAREDNATKIAVADIGAKLDALGVLMQQFQAVIASAAQGRDHAHERMMAEMGQQHALEQGQQAAALTPPPEMGA